MKKRAIVIAGAAIALASGLAGCANQPSGLDYYLTGRLDAQQGHMNAAIAELSRAIVRQPHLALAYAARGNLYKKRGDFHAAAKDYAAAARLEPFDFHSHYELGLMFQYLHKLASAINAYQQALEIRPMSPHANVNLALAYVQTGKPFKAIMYAQRARHNRRLHGRLAADLGIVYDQVANSVKGSRQQARYRNHAIDAFKIGIEGKPHSDRLYLNLAAEYMHLKQWNAARQVLGTAGHLAPSAAVFTRLGLCCYMRHHLQAAAKAYKTALRLSPKNSAALNGLGVVRMTESLQQSPPDVMLARAALKSWRMSLRINPHQPVIQRLVRKYAGKHKG